MKRGRISSARGSNTRRGITEIVEVSHIQTQTSFSDLPRDILVNILLRLSIKRLFIVKCVCKTLYNLVSDPEVAKLHFDQAEVCPLIRTTVCSHGSKMAYLVQPDKDEFELKLGMCDHKFSEPGCVCNVQVKIDTKFEIPETYGLFKHCGYQHGLVNSCNGLLCLSNPSNNWPRPPIICNPITGEFIKLPETNMIDMRLYTICYGFGFSPATNQYKVIRMFHQGTNVANKAEVHILGTKKWKEIGHFNQSMPKKFTTYLNGFLYWSSDSQPLSLLFTFDIEKECFGSVLGPDVNQHYRYDSMGVLGGELCISLILVSGDIHVWTMKDNGTEKAWSKVFSSGYIYYNPLEHYGAFRPIKYLNDGALLMFHPCKNALVYMDPKENRFRFLKVYRMLSKVEAIPFIPSFVSLRHVLSGHDVKVHKVRSRSAKLKLRREVDVDIVEQRFDSDHDFRWFDF